MLVFYHEFLSLDQTLRQDIVHIMCTWPLTLKMRNLWKNPSTIKLSLLRQKLFTILSIKLKMSGLLYSGPITRVQIDMWLSMHDKLSKIGNNFNFEDLRLNLTINRLRIMSDYQQELPWSQKKNELLQPSQKSFRARFSGFKITLRTRTMITKSLLFQSVMKTHLTSCFLFISS